MEKWATRYGRSRVQFLMVCVDSAGVAAGFGRMFSLKNVVNCWIPSRGFIISDKNGCFVSRKTKAYLQYGDAAFADVEAKLSKCCSVELPSNESVEDLTLDVLSPNWKLPSVGVQSMDKEHQECEEALSILLERLTVPSLVTVMEMLTHHFQQEESLMKASSFGRPGEQFSPFASHVKDHERILDIGCVELSRLHAQEEPNKSFMTMTCSLVGGNGNTS
eukprot:scaffold2604_cov198-Alexandrium_tamarense.AAC.15